MKQPEEVTKIDNNTIQLSFWNQGIGYARQTLKVKKIKTRNNAIDLCRILTIEALKKDNAYDNLHKFRNNFDKHRNYEIENYIAELTEDYTYKIFEDCPFNGFSWFSN